MKKALLLLLVMLMVMVTACTIEPGAAVNIPGVVIEAVPEQQQAAAPATSEEIKQAADRELVAAANLSKPAGGVSALVKAQPAAALAKVAAAGEAATADALAGVKDALSTSAAADLSAQKRFQAASGSIGELNPASRGGEPQPMPLDAPYTHPSGAFTVSVPQGWEVLSEDEAGTIWADNQSALMVLFLDAEAVYTKQEMNQFIIGFISSMFDNYKILEQRTEADDSIFVAIQFDSDGVQGDGDFFFEQRDTVVYVLYFGTTAYEEMLPTWEEIIGSYSVDPSVVVAPVQPEEPAAPSQPGPRPLAPKEPTPAPVPETSPFAPQAGRSRLYVFNEFDQELTFTINNGEHRIGLNAEIPIDLDPGRYTFTISIPGAAVNGEVEMGANQSWAVGVRGDGAVYEPFQVYP